MSAHPQLEISDDLTVVINRRSFGQLEPAAAFDLAERLVRVGMRRIFDQEAGAELVRTLEQEE